MRVLLNHRWTGEFLDATRGPRDYRIDVRGWRTLAPIDGLYFVRPKSPKLVWNYLQELGPAAVWQKVCSRWAERHRNEKYVACGCGVVLEAPPDGLPVGSYVVFLATKHSRCADRCVAPAELVAPLDRILPACCDPATVCFCDTPAEPLSDWLPALAGWDAEAGIPLNPAIVQAALRDCRKLLETADWDAGQRFPRSPQAPRERDDAPGRVAASTFQLANWMPAILANRLHSRPQAALFGYGNYAKTVILPNLRHYLDVVAVHEIDPLQLGRTRWRRMQRDTSDRLRPGERYDAIMIAGFHHTHAPLAEAALAQGAAAVVEKPTATTPEQLARLLQALDQRPGRLFECFQRRYTRLNEFAREDLELHTGAPVDYHCIVYEVPLPSRHWYRWPNSRTRLTSNGCHWVDHFLFLNNYAQPIELQVHAGPRGIAHVSMELSNGAYFTMTLTDAGSERVGVQDHVELRANHRTVFIENNARYHAEGKWGVIRRCRLHKLESYSRMYREIARQIAAGETVDARRSLRISAGTVLELERRLEDAAGPRHRRAA